MNRGSAGLESLQIGARDRVSEPPRGELRAGIGVKSVDRVVHGRDVDDVVRAARNRNRRGIKGRALDLAVDFHGEPLVKAIRARFDISRRKNGFSRVHSGSALGVASLEHVDRPQSVCGRAPGAVPQ